ncbi:hypothetical protein ANN_21630 [Periplaneta americana]|uniref:Uncharacterized protein n=1 Tax=Periplaneta americana TaxID=6978 RepID=A0ABQ8S615_PERAM|nr:hypothetical protein ANN_21630 [Periplaneta americana]
MGAQQAKERVGSSGALAVRNTIRNKPRIPKDGRQQGSNIFTEHSDIRNQWEVEEMTADVQHYQRKWRNHLLRMPEHRLPKRLLYYHPRGRRDLGRPHRQLHALYSSPDIIRNIKSRRLRWAGHVARMGESTSVYKVLVGRPEGKRPLGRPRRRWEDNIKMDLREMGYDDREWINLA